MTAEAEQRQLSTRALEVAAQVEGRLRAHEDHCLERAQEYREAIRDFRDKMDSHETKNSERATQIYTSMAGIQKDLNSFKSGGLVTIVLILLSVLGWIVTNGVPWRG
jgi:hypothetical protein